MSSGVDPAASLLRIHAWLETYFRRAVDEEDRQRARTVTRFVAGHPDCLLRSCREGHLTASAWVVNAARTRTLLTHHRKLGKWLQLGGHADGDPNLDEVALREVNEESGLRQLSLLSPEPFDLDCHRIPERRDTPEHWHFDVRFLVLADDREKLVVSEESHALAWVDLHEIAVRYPEESLLRMARKCR